MKSGAAAGGLALGLLSLSGCPAPTPPAPSPGATSPVGTSAEARSSPLVVTAAPALAEMVCALDGEEHLGGVSDYCTYPQSLTRLPRIGGAIDPNLEAIDGLRPDLVLLQGTHPALEALAERRPWRIERFRVETIADVLDALGRLGRLLDAEEAATRERARLEAAIAAARARRPKVAPRTLIVFGRRPGALRQLSCVGERTFVSELVRVAGGENCLAGLEGWPMVGHELLLERRPELILELSPEPLDAATRAALRADWAPLASLPAVAEGRIAIVSGSELLLPGPRLDRTLEKLGRALGGELDVE